MDAQSTWLRPRRFHYILQDLSRIRMFKIFLLATFLAVVASKPTKPCQGPQFIQQQQQQAGPEQQQSTCEFHNDPAKYVCPEKCSCSFRPSDKANVIDCQNLGMKQIPESLPVYPGANHTELLLQGNQLEEFAIDGKPGYSRVTHLYLSNNKISKFDTTGLSRRIKVVDISNNQLERLSDKAIYFMQMADKLDSIALSGNPYVCDCDTNHLVLFLRGGFIQIRDASTTTCPDGTAIEKLERRHICPDNPVPTPTPGVPSEGDQDEHKEDKPKQS